MPKFKNLFYSKITSVQPQEVQRCTRLFDLIRLLEARFAEWGGPEAVSVLIGVMRRSRDLYPYYNPSVSLSAFEDAFWIAGQALPGGDAPAFFALSDLCQSDVPPTGTDLVPVLHVLDNILAVPWSDRETGEWFLRGRDAIAAWARAELTGGTGKPRTIRVRARLPRARYSALQVAA